MTDVSDFVVLHSDEGLQSETSVIKFFSPHGVQLIDLLKLKISRQLFELFF
mgnify:CR=1 FL=1